MDIYDIYIWREQLVVIFLDVEKYFSKVMLCCKDFSLIHFLCRKKTSPKGLEILVFQVLLLGEGQSVHNRTRLFARAFTSVHFFCCALLFFSLGYFILFCNMSIAVNIFCIASLLHKYTEKLIEIA